MRMRMFWYVRFLLLAIIILQIQGGNGNGDDEKDNRFFRLYDNHSIEFTFPPALKGLNLMLSDMDEKSNILQVYDPYNCLSRLFLQYHLDDPSIIHPLRFHYPNMATQNYTLFNCSGSDYYGSCPILSVASNANLLLLSLNSCTMIRWFLSPIPQQHFLYNSLTIKLPFQPKVQHETSHLLITLLSITGFVVLLLLLVVCFYICRYFKNKGDDQVRLEKFLTDYKALKPSRFSYADLKRITNNFKLKLGEGAHGTVFKGKLSSKIEVAVKVLNHSDKDGQDFINEIGTLGKIHHINVVRLLGFCADGFHRALVYEFFPNGSLQNFISSPDDGENFLGWSKLQQIALNIAKGIEYLHQGCDYRILHFDINPHNVLLDDNFIPKISDFGLAKLCSKNQSMVSMTAARGTLGYIAPEVFSRNFGNVSYKSDIYSYGMLLLEIVGGRKNVDTDQETFQVLYPEWIHNLIEGSETSINMEGKVDTRIVKKLAIVGLWCIQWHSVNRPSIKTAIKMLEGEVDKLKMPPTPFDFNASTNNVSVIVPSRCLNSGLDVIHESE